jgi:hypothetical protein
MSDDWWTERQQNKRLQGLEADLSYVNASLSQARASQNRLKAELSKMSGSLEQRLDRLSAAFDAFVEISDLRVTLGLFDSHGRVRHQVKQLLAGAAPAEVSDADGYWLAPALVALRGVGDGAVDDEALALATARDPLRTRVFHVLLTSQLGGRSTVPSLDAVLPPLPDEVPAYQRAVWLLAADGFFGAAGWDLALARYAEFVSGSSRPGAVDDGAMSDGAVDDGAAGVGAAGVGAARESAAREGAVRESAVRESTVRDIAVPKAVVHVPKELDGGGSLTPSLLACERLTVLRTWVTEALEAFTNEPAATVDPVVRRTLDQLVDEGSTVEMPLLARERELRAVIEGKQTASSTWDSPGGATAELLRADLSSGTPNRRALAVRACAPVVLSLAEDFAETARTQPPSDLSVRTRYGQVTLTPAAPDAVSLGKAVDMVGRVSRVESKRREAAVAAAVIGAAFIVLAVVAGWGWIFVTLAGAAVAAYQWTADTRERRAAAEEAERNREALRQDVDQRVRAFAKARQELLDRQTIVEEDLKALRDALA